MSFLEVSLAFVLTTFFLTWIGYPFFCAVAATKAVSLPKDRPAEEQVSVVLATRDPPDVVAERVLDVFNSTSSNYSIDFVVAVDATSPYSLDDYCGAIRNQVRVVQGDSPGGKACTLNSGMRSALHESVVLVDSRQRFVSDVIHELMDAMRSSAVGAVSGTLQLDARIGSAPLVLRWFWKLETLMRRGEAAIHSVVAVTGAGYAMRKSLWAPLPAGLICDDLLVPLRIVRQGYRICASESAVFVDPRKFNREQEYNRKVRTLTGLLQVCLNHGWVLSPWQNPIWAQFLFHKILRLVSPALLGLAALIALAIAFTKVSLGLLLVPMSVGAIAFLFLVAISKSFRSQVNWTLTMLLAPLTACKNAAQGRWDVWKA